MVSASKAEYYAAGVAVVVLPEVIPAGGGALLPHEEAVEPVGMVTEMISNGSTPIVSGVVLAWCLPELGSERSIHFAPPEHRSTRAPEHLAVGCRLVASLEKGPTRSRSASVLDLPNLG